MAKGLPDRVRTQTLIFEAMPRRHFYTFDALRFLAFAKVFLLHLPVTAFPWFNFLRAGGGTGVSFFFVLSGFLITYILLEEKGRRGRIDLRSFYLRRVLRIWPLYYAMVAFAFLTPFLLAALHLDASSEGYAPRWYMSVFFLENYEMIRTGDHPNVSPLGVTWSLCIEEHFYLLWGLLLAFLPFRRLPLVAGGFILLAFAGRMVFMAKGWPTIDLLTNIDYFMYGALPAWLLLKYGSRLESRVLQLPSQLSGLFLTLVLGYVLISGSISYSGQAMVEPLVFGLSFAGLLLLILPRDPAWRIGDRNWLTRLGRYTYGLYLLHTIVINLCVQLARRSGLSLDRPLPALAFVLACFALTVFLALLSYHLLEQPFMRLRKGRERREVADQPVSAFSSPAEAEGVEGPIRPPEGR